MSGRPLLCYHTSNIYEGDVATLKPGAWLNDNVVAFWMDYLQHEVFSAQGADRFRFVSPGTAFILMHEEDSADFADTFEGCDVTPDTELVFFPLNDNVNVTKMGGSHWTLLVLDVRLGALYSFDSMSTSKSHSAAARKLANALSPLLPKLMAAANSNAAASASAAAAAAAVSIPALVSPVAPQQSNSSDCGVFAISIAESIAALRLNHPRARIDGDEVRDALATDVTAANVASKRAAIRDTIARLAKQ